MESQLEKDLREALKRQEFQLFYQPKLDLTSGKVMGVEALIRWNHPEKGLISPAEFIPFAEETGLIVPIGEWVLRTACKQNKSWQKLGIPPIVVAVNLSVRQLNQPDLIDLVQRILNETALSPEYLEIEITESMMMDVPHALPIIKGLKGLGIRISLDDFGTGYSSLYYLKEFPVDIIKIDQSFVKNCTISSKDATIIKAIIAMAYQLELDVIAEGIESREHLIFLQQNLCNQGQGYLFSKPLPPKEFVNKLDKIEQVVIKMGFTQEENKQKWLEESLKKAHREFINKAKQGSHIETLGIDISRRNMLSKRTLDAPFNEVYKSIIENDLDGIFILSMEGKLLEVNSVVADILGYSQTEILGMNYQTLLVPEYVEFVNQQISDVLQGIPHEFETQAFHKNGQIICLHMKNVPLTVDGEIVGVFGVVTDVTEIHKTQEELYQTVKIANDLQYALNVSSMVLITDRKGIIQFVNENFCKNSKHNKEELIGQDSRISNSGYHTKEFYSDLWKTIKKGEVWKGEIRNKAKDGTYYWVDTTIVPLLDNTGKPYQYVSIRNNITDRKKVEESLRQSQEKYRLIAENMSDIVSLIDKEGFFIYASPSHETVLGLTSEVSIGKPIKGLVHKDDYLKFQDKLVSIMDKREIGVFEYRLLNMDKKEVWMEGKITPIYDKKEDFQHFLIVSREIAERKIYEEKLNHLAYHDGLTGLPNRRWFKDRMEQAIREAVQYGRKMAVMFIDIDKFKSINDSFGHEVGDILLKKFAERVKGCLRERDTLARQGGDEFTVLLPEIENEQYALLVVERILTCLQDSWNIKNHIFETTSSIGIAFYPADGITRHELLRNADEALYVAKQSGRNRLRAYKWA